jgi:hypothetical protein
MGFEVAGGFLLLVWMIFTKAQISWIEILFFAVFCGISAVLQMLDDKLYLYVIEEDKDD